jgi:hypothetical protein
MAKAIVASIAIGVWAIGCSAADPSEEVARPPLTAVGVDCREYQQYSAALATLTVDCTGTIGPHSYRISEGGLLERAFERCAVGDQARVTQIDALLSLQRRKQPLVRQCLAGNYADFLASFDRQECPTWEKVRTVNPLSLATIDAVTNRLQALRAQPASLPDELEEKNLYRVSGEGAAACARGFAGFVIRAEADSVLTDPPVWLLGTTYPNAASDPFLSPGYYHPMSFYGPLPGAIYANYARYAPCPGCPPEKCSYYAGIHIRTRLQADCLDPTDLSTCVAYCGPPLP